MRYLLNTEIGTFGLWDEDALDFVKDKASYLANLAYEKDMIRVMNENSVVLWGTGGDGHRPVEVRINQQTDLGEFSQYKEMESAVYKLEVKSGKVFIGSPEWAGSMQEEGLANERDGIKVFELQNGIYRVKIFFLAWDYDDESLEDLPEYVVFIDKEKDTDPIPHATSLEVLG